MLARQALGPFFPAIHTTEHPPDDIVALTERMRNGGVDITTDFPPDTMHAYPMSGRHELERTESSHLVERDPTRSLGSSADRVNTGLDSGTLDSDLKAGLPMNLRLDLISSLTSCTDSIGATWVVVSMFSKETGKACADSLGFDCSPLRPPYHSPTETATIIKIGDKDIQELTRFATAYALAHGLSFLPADDVPPAPTSAIHAPLAFFLTAHSTFQVLASTETSTTVQRPLCACRHG